MEEEKKVKKPSEPFLYHLFVKNLDADGTENILHCSAEKKSEITAYLTACSNPEVICLVKGRLLKVKQRTFFKI